MAKEVGGIEVVLALNSNNFDKGINKADKSVNKFGKDTTKAISNVAKEIPYVGNALSSIESAFGGVSANASALTGVLGGVGAAVAGVAVAAAALAAVSLGAYFTGTQQGADEFEQGMNRLDFLLGAIETKFQDLGGVIASFLPDLTDLFPEDVISRADKLTAASQKAAKFRLNNTVKVAEIESKIANEIFKTRELARPYEERSAALDNAEKLLKEQAAIERQLLKNELEIVQAKNNNTESLREDLQLEKDLLAEIERRNKRETDQLREIQNRKNEAANAEKARIKSIEAAEKKRDDERVKAFTKIAEQELKNYETSQSTLRKEGEAYAAAFSQFGDIAKSSFGEATSAAQQFGQSMAGILIDLIAQQLGVSIANAITGATGAAAVAGPLAPAVLPATIASMTGSVLAAFASIPSFASGGTYRHSEAGQSENIIPTNRMNEVFNSNQAGRETVIEIDGQPILRASEKASNKRNRTRSINSRF